MLPGARARCACARRGGDFVQCCVSAQGGWVHGIAEDSHLYSFDAKDGKLQNLLKVARARAW
eukprot:3336623-Prymnesium_polylepis.3